MAEELVKPKSRQCKQQTATICMFKWALTLEREREAESLDAGR